ncbi:hypothetical protein HJG54_19670 [Leptolyngbya sp. NK1-12]|uniref:Uncharacterized protein n=1 Tax=Leptolyngbya sp. NK1-12 TaxID=2547451 RepID=A0AA96WET9_9CYAN|nr:hypothetical protein [Leptolyngbya sp. NK1-12]WNZ24847.1 hypothetical protein HJG54_19670 [Leptolyngbya sp. NK1-12]
MPANVYESRREVWVTPFTGAGIKYGFLTNVSTAVGTACGHTAVDRANPPVGLVFGANAPKPGRASKRRADGIDSTFYDISKVSTLRSGGYSLTAPTIRRGRATVASKAVYVDLNGVKYAWRMPLVTYNKIADDRAVLGIEDADQNDRDLVWGARFPKPPKAAKTIITGSSVDVISTFVDPASIDNLPAGWSTAGREKVLG